MKSVSAREANQAFSKLLAEAAGGEEIVITRRGKPVAKLVSVETDVVRARTARKRAADRLLRRLEKGVPLGGLRIDREEIYDR
jgi:prevent-host-death family protein